MKQENFGNNNENGPTLLPANKIQQNSEIPHQQPPQILGKTKIFNEIQEQIKKNFGEELDKLRQEMSSRNKQMRNQMEGLQNETEKAVRERNEANKELQKMKEFLDKKNEQEGYQSKLLNAINRYAPPGSEEQSKPEKRVASRGGVNMNNYEKMFFNGGGKDIQLAGKSLKADSAMVPVDQNAAIANYFYKGNIQNQEETFKADKQGIPIFEKSLEPLKKTQGIEINGNNPYNGNIEIPTLDSGIKRKIKRDKIKYDYNLVSAEKSTIRADDTLDFINKINGVGREIQTQNNNKPTRKDSLSKKANELRRNNLNDS